MASKELFQITNRLQELVHRPDRHRRVVTDRWLYAVRDG